MAAIRRPTAQPGSDSVGEVALLGFQCYPDLLQRVPVVAGDEPSALWYAVSINVSDTHFVARVFERTDHESEAPANSANLSDSVQQEAWGVGW